MNYYYVQYRETETRKLEEILWQKQSYILDVFFEQFCFSGKLQTSKNMKIQFFKTRYIV